MKQNTKTVILMGLLLVFGYCKGFSQTKAKPTDKVKKRTIMEQFETEYVMSVEDRIALKEKRYAHQIRAKKILDTLAISDRKRKKLMKELRKRPFSQRINKAILVETMFEDAIEKPQKK
ncbi:hypothetical protein [Maribacter sp. 2210JD10-5]|uniref:hypothetical protein n=1 Tax=Maribacter sp. 2210JD10-5 TaxID=3386272 RepID=UPI0039BCC76C